MTEMKLNARLEALLFVASNPITPAQIAASLDIPQRDIELAINELSAEYENRENPRGVRLQRYRGRVQLTSMPEAAPDIERFLGLEAITRLTRAALEALAIIAYLEPVTRPQIDSIRGVNSDGVLRSLLSKGLIEEVGRAEAPGRPILYSITAEFLQQFGLSSKSELPPLQIQTDTKSAAEIETRPESDAIE